MKYYFSTNISELDKVHYKFGRCVNPVKDAILHAEEDSPKESCGYISHEGGMHKYFPLFNTSDSPELAFTLSKKDEAEIMRLKDKGLMDMIVHSHPTGTPFSNADTMARKQVGITYLVISLGKNDTYLYWI